MTRNAASARQGFMRSFRNCALLSIPVLLIFVDNLEARHWRHHHHHHRLRDEEHIVDYAPVPHYAEPKREQQERHTAALAQKENGFGQAVERVIRGCNDVSAGLKKQSMEDLIQGISLDSNQRAALEQLQSVVVQAAETLSAACPVELRDSASSQIADINQIGQAYVTAIDTIKPELENFYASLTDEQKAQLIALHIANRAAEQNDSTESNSGGSGFCQKWERALRNWPIREVEERISLSDTQHAALFELAAAMYREASTLVDSCPKETSLTLLGQFDARRKQIAALLKAIDGIRPALEHLVDVLNEGQRRILNVVNRE